MINEGDRAPGLDVTTSDGRSVTLARPGKPLVLYFYPKDDTSGCTREAQDFTALAGDFAKAGALVVGVSRDPMKKHEKFIGKYDLKVPANKIICVGALRRPRQCQSRGRCRSGLQLGKSKCRCRRKAASGSGAF